MKKAFFPVLVSLALALSCIQPAYAWTLTVFNKTDKEIQVTVRYHTKLCKDDGRVKILPHGKWSVNAGLCKVSTVNASMMTGGYAVACVPRNGTGADNYFIVADSNMKSCHVD